MPRCERVDIVINGKIAMANSLIKRSLKVVVNQSIIL